MKFEIFAGLGGSFDNEVSMGIEEFESNDDALDAAYEDACDVYDRYSGTGELDSQEDIVIKLKADEDNAEATIDEIEETAWEIYDDQRENLIKYHIVEIIE